MRAALDTNIMAYAEGVDGAELQATAMALIARLSRGNAAVPMQTLGELYNVLIRKAGRSRDLARLALLKWRAAYPVIETSDSIMLAAIDLSADHHLSIWDSVIMAAAVEGGCRLLLSQDMQNGFTWRGVTVANPFVAKPHPLLNTFLRGDRGYR